MHNCCVLLLLPLEDAIATDATGMNEESPRKGVHIVDLQMRGHHCYRECGNEQGDPTEGEGAIQ